MYTNTCDSSRGTATHNGRHRHTRLRTSVFSAAIRRKFFIADSSPHASIQVSGVYVRLNFAPDARVRLFSIRLFSRPDVPMASATDYSSGDTHQSLMPRSGECNRLQLGRHTSISHTEKSIGYDTPHTSRSVHDTLHMGRMVHDRLPAWRSTSTSWSWDGTPRECHSGHGLSIRHCGMRVRRAVPSWR